MGRKKKKHSKSRNERVNQKKQKRRANQTKPTKKAVSRLGVLARDLKVQPATLVAYIRYTQGYGIDGTAPIRLTDELIQQLRRSRKELRAWERGDLTPEQEAFFKSEPVYYKQPRKGKDFLKIIYTPMGGKR